MSKTRPVTSSSARRAFTLIELLVVLIIIAVIISIVLPAIGKVRQEARKAATRGEITKINNAAMVFFNDEKRMPGYFTAREMGSAENEQTYGMSEMQNAMLDLAGFVTGTDQVGPTAATQMGIDANAIGAPQGANNKVYYAPDGKHFVVQSETGQQMPAGTTHSTKMPTLVDDFGNPYCLWRADDTAVQKVSGNDALNFAKIAKVKLTGANDASARFYWASNSCYLKATSFGKRSTDQKTESMIGELAPDADKVTSLAGFLGNPSWPYKNAGVMANPAIPTTARWPFIVHSAGPDGIFLSKKDRGAKQFGATTIDYTVNFLTAITNQPYADKDGKPTNIDIMEKFDDLIGGTGN